jgi:serine/threonine protein kinase
MSANDLRTVKHFYEGPEFAPPPEQMIGMAEPRSDLFALAGLLYFLATGKQPLGCYTAREIEELLNDPTQPVSAKDRWFYELLRINLSENPNDRSESAQQFKTVLERRCLINR